MYIQFMRKIKLTQGRYAIVDDDDYNKLVVNRWYYGEYGKTGYAKRASKDRERKCIRMHHEVLPLVAGYMIDHINGDGLDNRKQNLRLVTKSQNMMNSGVRKNSTSGYKGVCWAKRYNKWVVHIWKDYKQIFIGYFKDPKEAALAYNKAAKIYHGEYAYMNQI